MDGDQLMVRMIGPFVCLEGRETVWTVCILDKLGPTQMIEHGFHNHHI